MRRKNLRPYILPAFSGLIAGLIVLSQMDLGEVLRVDRFQHFTLSLLLFMATFVVFGGRVKSLLPAVLVTLSIGFLKEWGDPTFQSFDMVANGAGIMFGLALYAITPLFHPQKRYYHPAMSSQKRQS